MFFYPADFTFVCPTELGDLADNYAEFQRLGVEIYSVSTDTHFTHKAWHDTSDTIGKIQYPMIGDPTGDDHPQLRRPASRARAWPTAARSSSTPTASSSSSRSPPRASAATPSSCSARSRPPSTSAAHPDEVCPAKWEEGDDTLAPSLDLVGKI